MQSAVSAIQAKTGNKHVEGYTADFKRLDAVRRLAEEVRQRHETLSVLINNAGAPYWPVLLISQQGLLC